MGKPAMKDCNAVAALRRLGAIPFVKTNVPQSLMVRMACGEIPFYIRLLTR